MSELTIYFYPKFETATDSGDHTTYNLRGYTGLASNPAPAVYVNGVLKTVTTDYAFNVGSSSVHCSITFTAPLTVSDVVTCSYKWTHACADDEDVSVYEFDKLPNVKDEIDVNGKNMITEGYAKYTGFHGVLTWPYPDYAWWDEIRNIAENPGGTIDVARDSLTAGLATKTITNLYIKNYPKWNEQPGVLTFLGEMTIEVTKIE